MSQVNDPFTAETSTVNDTSVIDSSDDEATKALNEIRLQLALEENTSIFAGIFGSDWDGTVPRMTNILSTEAAKTAVDLSYYTSVSQFLSANYGVIKAIGGNNIASSISSLETIKNNTIGTFNSLSTTFSNFGSISFDTNSTDSVARVKSYLNGLDSVLSNTEQVVNYVETLANNVTKTMEQLEKLGQNIEEFYENAKEKFENLEETLSNLSDNFVLNFPFAILNQIIDISIINNLLLLPTKVINSIKNVTVAITTFKDPEIKMTFMLFLKSLKKVISSLKNVVNTVSDGVQAINNLKLALKSLKNSKNWTALLVSASVNALFAQKPSPYAAKYPYARSVIQSSPSGNGAIIAHYDTTDKAHIQLTATSKTSAINSGATPALGQQGDYANFDLSQKNGAQFKTSKVIELIAKEDLNVQAENIKLAHNNELHTQGEKVTIDAKDTCDITGVNTVSLNTESEILGDINMTTSNLRASASSYVAISASGIRKTGVAEITSDRRTTISSTGIINITADEFVNITGGAGVTISGASVTILGPLLTVMSATSKFLSTDTTFTGFVNVL